MKPKAGPVWSGLVWSGQHNNKTEIKTHQTHPRCFPSLEPITRPWKACDLVGGNLTLGRPSFPRDWFRGDLRRGTNWPPLETPREAE
ncbi:hypothetical protein E2C01_067803 [Portunus trituberculatus]|uniref:Uncharacterized protein n=1 Tax=Portunus trituberculatus TaxID=210409 RepID=A0A5B7HU11_PORTR|nr:hypothetical protein [Portunus trituberculatus]